MIGLSLHIQHFTISSVTTIYLQDSNISLSAFIVYKGLKDIRIFINMYEINPFTDNSVSINSHRYDDICKTGIYNHYIPIKAERKVPPPLKEIEETDTLTILLKTGNYRTAFRYMFETGNPIPLKIVPKLLNAFRGHRLSFYSLIDFKLSIFCSFK